MRNIQKNVIKWKKDSKISDIIKKLPDFCNYYENELFNCVIPNIGEYYLHTYQYDINDFMKNPNNKIFNILLPMAIINKENEKEEIFLQRFFIVTSVNCILFEPIDKKYKNICKINYVGDLYEINQIKIFFKERQEEYKDLTCFKLVWNQHYSNKLNNIFCIENNTGNAINISKIINERKELILKGFKTIENKENATIAEYSYIIAIKENFVRYKTNEIIYEEINSLYQKIIETLTFYDGDEYRKYLDNQHKFLERYHKLLDEEEKKKEINNKKKNEKNNININSIKNNIK